jgi:hypothetical protein
MFDVVLFVSAANYRHYNDNTLKIIMSGVGPSIFNAKIGLVCIPL